jgi:cellulose synthase/poly-beta-1,6-N-acetylglucosamine synthase-like glycosyltransferase
MSLFQVLLNVAGLLLLVPVSILFLQVVLACLPLKKAPRALLGKRPSIVVLVPAHNESLVLENTLNSIFPQLIEGDRLLVVADNCSDGTAKIALANGAEVIERIDLERRGKGYALDFGIRHLLKTNPPEVIVIIDADCHVSEGAIDKLARLCVEKGRPIQALDLMTAPLAGSLNIRVAEFAWLVKNQVRPLGFYQIGLPCQLMGTGMAFPWHILSKASLASGHLVEDMKLGIDLTRSGLSPLFCPEARVTSVFPDSVEGADTQRVRWEHGHLGMIIKEAPKRLVEAIFKLNVHLFALILDLTVPPLALLLLMILMLFGISLVNFAISGSPRPVFLTGIELFLMGTAVLIAWWRFGQHILNLKDFANAPMYALRKIPLYFKFLAGRQVEWVRSKRDKD